VTGCINHHRILILRLPWILRTIAMGMAMNKIPGFIDFDEGAEAFKALMAAIG